jgi:DNA invertase Pin-like site-specific DNA recombinase
MLGAGDTLVVRWLDRLGRNYADVTDIIREFIRRGVIVRTVVNGMVFDGTTKDPMQMAVRDALIGFMAAIARRRPRLRRKRSAPASRPIARATAGASRAIPARS